MLEDLEAALFQAEAVGLVMKRSDFVTTTRAASTKAEHVEALWAAV